jgi:hypothetical protein
MRTRPWECDGRSQGESGEYSGLLQAGRRSRPRPCKLVTGADLAIPLELVLFRKEEKCEQDTTRFPLSRPDCCIAFGRLESVGG